MYCQCVCSLRYPACNAHAPYYIVICYIAMPGVVDHLAVKNVAQGAPLGGGNYEAYSDSKYRFAVKKK